MPTDQFPLELIPTTLPAEPEQARADISWRDVSEIARGAGFRGACLVSAELQDQLDDQAMFDALWTACFTLALDDTDCALFTLEVDGEALRFKTLKTTHAAYLGRVEDF